MASHPQRRACPGSAFCAGSSFPDVHPRPYLPLPLRRALPTRLMKYLLPSRDGIPAHSCACPSLSTETLSCSRLVPSSFCSAMLWTALRNHVPDTSRPFQHFPLPINCPPSILSMVLLSHFLSHTILATLCDPALFSTSPSSAQPLYLSGVSVYWPTCLGPVCLSRVCSQFLGALILGSCAC